ncbi:transposase [Cobetia sp. 5-25-4-2]|uniref:transposase n=1 Tax=Cobetia sp. 5-25-4-2 TaxID=2737459 RepID=UPI0035D4430D
MYRQRNIVERSFSWLKEFHRIATRYERLARSFCAIVYVAYIRRCLRADFSYRTYNFPCHDFHSDQNFKASAHNTTI